MTGHGALRCWACEGPTKPSNDFEPVPYLRCDRCGFYFQPERAREEVRALYDEGYFSYHAGGGGYAENDRQRTYEATVRVRLLRRWARPGPLLEVGSAGGHLLAAAAKAGWGPVLGIEPVEGAVLRSRQAFGVEVVEGFVEDIDLPEDEFTAAGAFHVLEHMQRPRPALERIRKTLRPGGRLLVEVPNAESVPARVQRGEWGALEPRHHLGHFAPRSLRTMLERAGFDVLHVETVPFYAYLRPAAKVHPRHLVARLGLSRMAGVTPWGPHPDRHELLRAVAEPR